MKKCKTSVPVWIMPFSRAAESFADEGRKFDVVVIDEASQCDPLALLAFYMGKKIIVVGDDKQVSPLAVGTLTAPVQNLIQTYLTDVPHKNLYDGTTSVYAFASLAFGGKTIRLLEHFRSVPDIIQFSNGLCYNYEMKPLRDPSKVVTVPFVVSYHVEGGTAKDKLNKLEAEAVASLLIAAIEQPEYAKKTFGVICLVGISQSLEIDRLLRERLSPKDYEEREILCGNPSQFQGDERDIMFLSIVDSPSGGPLSYRQEAKFEQRFNVAASRARDQMWVVHSLDPNIDLKPGDLRQRLIQYAENPDAFANTLQAQVSRAESPFEKEVIRRIVSRGYRVKSQYKVGYYRIDLVVEGDGKKLAVECDGDRYHLLAKIPEDMARQAVLERLGWRFVRIRGSQFYRDPESAMEPVFAKLSQLGIEPSFLAAPNAAPPGTTHESKQRIIRRAAELRGEWSIALVYPIASETVAPATLPLQVTGSTGQLSFKVTQGASAVPTNDPLAAKRNNGGRISELLLPQFPKTFASPADSSSGSSLYGSLRKWAESNGTFQLWELELLGTLDRIVSLGRTLSEDQANHAERLLNMAAAQGFTFSGG